MTVENWLPVSGFEGVYSVSDLGRVRRDSAAGRARAGRILKPSVDIRGGYLSVSLYNGGLRTRVRRKVHVLVAETFIGPRPIDMDVCHGDGDCRNNVLPNLRYGTRSDNLRDSVSHGTHPWSSRTHCRDGHVLNEANTYVTPQGIRRCRACKRARYYERKAA